MDFSVIHKDLLPFMEIGTVIYTPSGIIKEVNKTFCEITGYTEDELVSKNISDIYIIPNSIDEINQKKQLTENKIVSYTSQKIIVTKNKNIKWLTTFILQFDSNFIEIIKDVSEKKYFKNISNVLENISDAFFSLDRNWCFTYMNKKAGEIFNCNPKEIIGKHIWTEFPKGVGQVFYHAYYKATETQQFVIFEEYYPPYKKWFENRIFPSIEGLSIFLNDITERKIQEIKLKESEDKFQKAFSSSPDAIIISSFLDGIYIDVNESFLNLTEYQRDEIIGKSSVELNIWDNLEDRKNFIHEFTEKGYVRNFEAKYRSKSGKKQIVSINAEIIYIQNQKCILAQSREITEQKKIEETLIKKQSELQALFDTSLDAITITDANGMFLTANKALLERWGKSKEELVGHSAKEVLLPHIFKDRVKRVNQVIKTKKHQRFIDIRGDLVYENTISPIIEPDGSVKNVAMFSRDISEQKNAEKNLLDKNNEYQSLNEEYYAINEELTESLNNIKKINSDLEIAKTKAEEGDKLKTSFLQNLSHEIRTPLNAIMGFSDLLKDVELDKESIFKYASIIHQRGNDLLDIINDIIDIAKIESGNVPIIENTCIIKNICNEIEHFFNEYKVRLKKEHMSLQFKFDGISKDSSAILDNSKLKQVVTNLISNSLKYSEQGTITVTISKQNEEFLKISVADNGIGIPEDQKSRVFERFVQLQNNQTQIYGGNGLGLAIVKGIIHIIGGTITLDSEINKGTIITFTFPFQKISEQNTNEIQFSDTKSTELQLSILIVEDEPCNQMYIQKIFEKQTHTIFSANTGNKAIEIALHEHIDCILMDLNLPDISGFEAIKTIKKQKPEIKIICQSAYNSEEDTRKAQKLGSDAFISKPYTKESIFSIISELFTSKEK